MITRFLLLKLEREARKEWNEGREDGEFLPHYNKYGNQICYLSSGFARYRDEDDYVRKMMKARLDDMKMNMRSEKMNKNKKCVICGRKKSSKKSKTCCMSCAATLANRTRKKSVKKCVVCHARDVMSDKAKTCSMSCAASLAWKTMRENSTKVY